MPLHAQLQVGLGDPGPQNKLSALLMRLLPSLNYIFATFLSDPVVDRFQEVGEEELSQAIGGWEITAARLTSSQSASLFIQNSLGRDGLKLFQSDHIVSAFRHLFHFLGYLLVVIDQPRQNRVIFYNHFYSSTTQGSYPKEQREHLDRYQG